MCIPGSGLWAASKMKDIASPVLGIAALTAIGKRINPKKSNAPTITKVSPRTNSRPAFFSTAFGAGAEA